MISTDAIILRVSDLTEDGVHVEAVEEPQWLVNLPELWSDDSNLKILSNIGIDLLVTRVLKEVSVMGNIRLLIEVPCSRCLEPVEMELNPAISLVLSPGEKLSEQDDDIEHETYIGDEIDLSNYLMEQVAISLPVKVLCKEDCKGLCTSCGADLNYEICACDKEHVDHRFAVLKKLKI